MMVMEKGHMELGEVLFVALLIVGLAAAVMLVVDGGKSPPAVPPWNGSAHEGAPAPAQPEAAIGEGNGTAPAQPEAQDKSPPPATAKPAGVILDEGLARADALFYSNVTSGVYTVKTYRWTMGLENQSPDAIPLKQNDLRAADVRFSGTYLDALRGFAFRHYYTEDLSAPPQLHAVALFISGSTPLDGLNSTFNVQYDPYPGGPQVLEGCSVRNSSVQANGENSTIKVYDLTCRIMYGVYP
jgi:hypothetical protein